MLIPKLRECEGNLAAVARAFGVTRQAVYHYGRRHPALQEVVTECRETMKDEGESALYKAVKAGEAWAVCFYLKCQAKDRGYVERLETKDVSSVEMEIVEEIVDGGSVNTPAANPEAGATPPDAAGVPAE